jgi:hypothetical protein
VKARKPKLRHRFKMSISKQIWLVFGILVVFDVKCDGGCKSSTILGFGASGGHVALDQVLTTTALLPSMSEPEEINPYQLLDISLDATDSDIKSAYRKLSLKVHPDRVRVQLQLQPITSNLSLKEQKQSRCREKVP